MPVTWLWAYGANAFSAASRSALLLAVVVGSTATEKNVPPFSDELIVLPDTVQVDPDGANAA